jgi:hypothetical protein
MSINTLPAEASAWKKPGGLMRYTKKERAYQNLRKPLIVNSDKNF